MGGISKWMAIAAPTSDSFLADPRWRRQAKKAPSLGLGAVDELENAQRTGRNSVNHDKFEISNLRFEIIGGVMKRGR